MLIKDLLFALRLKDASYTADLPITGRLRGEIGRDGLPTYFTGKLGIDAGSIVDRRAPEYPMNIDRADVSVDWDSTRRVLVAPFQVVAGPNRITLLAHLEPPSDSVPNWQLGLSGGTIVLPGTDGETPLIFNRIAVRMRFDIEGQRILLTQGDISNGTVGVAGTGIFDYSTAEPRLTAGFAGTPMSASELKRMWPVVINPEVREWVLDRVDGGLLQRAEVAINAPTHTLARGGPPIPDDGLSINFIANNVKVRPVDGLPQVTDAGMRVRITGRTANVSIAQATMETPGGRKMGVVRFRVRNSGYGAEADADPRAFPRRRAGAGHCRNHELRSLVRVLGHADRSRGEQGHDLSGGDAGDAAEEGAHQAGHDVHRERRPERGGGRQARDESEA